jgi:ComF family protein
MRLLQALKAFILNTLFPPVCVSCKKEGDFLCEECLKNLDKKKICPLYYKTEKDPDFHYMDGVIYALDYAKNLQIQAAVKQLKYRFTQELAEYFGDMIAEKIGELNMAKNRKIIFIPVPLHRKRLNYRGFNQAEIIANAVARRIPDDRAEIISLLTRERETQQQAKLNKEERHKNLKGAFIMSTKIVHQYSSKNLYFLVDDVCTTGSTLENCAEVLRANGFEKVYGLVIARAFK